MTVIEQNTGDTEVLAFRLGDEEYGVELLKVQEIRNYETVTRIAEAPDYVKGVINLRGVIVPIIDMRIRLHLDTATYDQFTVVVILNVRGRVAGMVVDGVSDVVTLQPGQIKPAPEMRFALNADYLIGMGTLEQRMLILVDIDELMAVPEMDLIERLAA